MKKIIIFTVLLIVLSSCLTPKEDPEPVKNTIKIDEPELVQETPEPPVLKSPTKELAPKAIVKKEVYVATEEEYDQTFTEVELLITKLNKIISSRDFIEWQKYLSESYINKNSNKEFLAELSENPVLKDYNIKLKKLRDYFNYVVLPARSNVIVDEIQFITEDKIKVFTYVNSNKFIIYTLIRSNDSWIISE